MSIIPISTQKYKLMKYFTCDGYAFLGCVQQNCTHPKKAIFHFLGQYLGYLYNP